jgi:hypothetical protein
MGEFLIFKALCAPLMPGVRWNARYSPACSPARLPVHMHTENGIAKQSNRTI